jgi:4-hydroxy-3-methylbut-2-enyl diphosphate reductase
MTELIGEEQLYYRKGFGLKQEVAGDLAHAYHSNLVERIVAAGHRLDVEDMTIRLAQEFGNCYGVDRAVQYAYETRQRFPNRRLFLTGELIVLLPAFGAPTDIMRRLRDIGCVLVDTTCGSVLLVWKTVERFAQDGYTAIIHGKYYHEETQATASRALEYPDGGYLVVRDLEEAGLVTDFIRQGGDASALLEKFANATSPGFDFDVDLERVGIANQTTMLMRETEAVAEMFRSAMIDRHGEAALDDHYRALDTICSATQERQDAVQELLLTPPQLMIVLGGYNSSNTNNLTQICQAVVPTYHIDDSSCIEGPNSIRHKPVDQDDEIRTVEWLTPGPIEIGMTAGASTPNNKVGETIERLLACRGQTMPVG